MIKNSIYLIKISISICRNGKNLASTTFNFVFFTETYMLSEHEKNNGDYEKRKFRLCVLIL